MGDPSERWWYGLLFNVGLPLATGRVDLGENVDQGEDGLLEKASA
jgi:hypothetical protein